MSTQDHPGKCNIFCSEPKVSFEYIVNFGNSFLKIKSFATLAFPGEGSWRTWAITGSVLLCARIRRGCVWVSVKVVRFTWIKINIFTARNEVGARLCFHTCLWFCSRGEGLPQCMLGYTPPPPGTRGTHHPPTRGRPPCAVHAGIRSTSGRYGSYWNAILLEICDPTSEHQPEFLHTPFPGDSQCGKWHLLTKTCHHLFTLRCLLAELVRDTSSWSFWQWSYSLGCNVAILTFLKGLTSLLWQG